MDAAAAQKLAYWSWAFANMVLLVTLASFGVRRVRARQVAAHRRLMLSAAGLVLLFVASYLAKVSLWGREPLALWDPFYVAVLRLHEACVAVMLVAGSTALVQARRRGLAREVPPRDATRWHRRAGWTALVAGALGIVTAGVVLWGMFQRLEMVRAAGG